MTHLIDKLANAQPISAYERCISYRVAFMPIYKDKAKLQIDVLYISSVHVLFTIFLNFFLWFPFRCKTCLAYVLRFDSLVDSYRHTL